MDVDETLRRAAQQLNASLADERIPEVPRRAPRRGWGAMALALGAVVAVALVGSVALLRRDGASPPVGVDPVPSTISTPSTEPPPGRDDVAATTTTAAPSTSTDTDTETVSSASGAVAETLAMLDIAFEQDSVYSKYGIEIKADLEYVYNYLTGVTESDRWPEPEFDTSSLGDESILTEIDPVAFLDSRIDGREFMGPPSSNNGGVPMVPFVAGARLEGTTDVAVFTIVLAFKDDIVDVQWRLFSDSETPQTNASSQSSPPGGYDHLEVPNVILVHGSDRGPLIIGGLPPEASVIATTFRDGTKVWQHPVSGLAIFDDPERACVETATQECDGEYTVLNAAGDELLRIVDHGKMRE